jgi:hypothetical protein
MSTVRKARPPRDDSPEACSLRMLRVVRRLVLTGLRTGAVPMTPQLAAELAAARAELDAIAATAVPPDRPRLQLVR